MEKRKNNANKCMRNLRENDTFIDNEQRTPLMNGLYFDSKYLLKVYLIEFLLNSFYYWLLY